MNTEVKKLFIMVILFMGLYVNLCAVGNEWPFVSVWNTDERGLSARNQVRLPLVENGEYDFSVDWGDGSSDAISEYTDPALTHTYDKPGKYIVSISGKIIGWSFGSEVSDKLKLIEIRNWGPLAFGDTEKQFFYACYLTVTAADAPDLSGTKSLKWAFAFCPELSTIPNMNNWDTSAVTDFSGMFERSKKFNADISGWDTSSVTTMERMFSLAESFNQDLSSWDFSSLENARYMFESTSMSVQNYNRLLISLSKQELKENVIFHVSGLRYLGKEASDARDYLDRHFSWYIDGDSVFAPEFPISPPDSSGIRSIVLGEGTGMDLADVLMSEYEGNDEIRWESTDPKAVSVKDGIIIAQNAGTSVISATGSESGVLGKWRITSDGRGTFITVWDTSRTGKGRTKDSQIKLPLASRGKYNLLVNWGDGTQSRIKEYNAAEAVHTYPKPGIYEVSIKGLLNGWQFGQNQYKNDAGKLLEIKSWGCMEFGPTDSQFYNCRDLVISAKDIPGLANTRRLSHAFANCFDLEDVPNMGQWDVSGIETMEGMFGQANDFNADISGWDTGKVESMEDMFNNAEAFNQDISGWNTSAVKTMKNMFKSADSFDQDISLWDFSRVKDFNGFLYETRLSVSNYTRLLKRLSENSGQVLVTLDGGLSYYAGDEAEKARSRLVDSFGWKITDNGKCEFHSYDETTLIKEFVRAMKDGDLVKAANLCTKPCSCLFLVLYESYKDCPDDPHAELKAAFGANSEGLEIKTPVKNGNHYLVKTVSPGMVITYAIIKKNGIWRIMAEKTRVEEGQ